MPLFFSSNIYLQMAAWAEHIGLKGSAVFLKAHTAEEQQHMEKLFSYLLETGDLQILGAIAAPSAKYESLEHLFKEILFNSILDKIKVIGTEGRGLYLIGKEIEKQTYSFKKDCIKKPSTIS